MEPPGSAKAIKWLQCDGCDGWFHLSCVGLRKVPQQFKCSSCLGTSAKQQRPVRSRRIPAKYRTEEVAQQLPTPEATSHVPDTTPSAPEPATEVSAQYYRIIPTQGDGRCFFRSVAIGLHPELQSASRDRVSGKLHDTVLDMRETLAADQLRAATVNSMMENFEEYSVLGPDVENADMPAERRYSSMQHRIWSMARSTEMPGELEIVALVRCLQLPLEIVSGDATYQFGREHAALKDKVKLRHTRFQDAGHYELLVKV